MLPLIVAPALRELVHAAPGTPAYNQWVGLLFWIPAIAGGVFGLLGGYLTDRLGRRRVLVWSILIYAFSAFAAGFSTTHLAVPLLPLHDVHRRLRRVRRGRRVARGALPRSEAARARARLHAGVLVGRRRAGRRCANCARRQHAASLPGDPRRARGVALHADVRRHSGAAADPHPAVPARVAGLAAEARGRHAASGRASRRSSVRSCAARRSSRR